MKKLQILGTGCKKCVLLAENAEAAAKELGIDYEIEKITDIGQITDMGVMMTPALAINDTVVLSGKTSSQEEIKTILKNLQ
ncbi:MAG: thioredoxin family protein [Methylobacter sp.]|jgi:small redox-active disulfide protein 2|nr:thioredoxin family protein [Methylobacter sp.]MDP2100357.1 thioredoxin family protein [Methylobacter sp.]MDP2427843.1 thioredoxin family protein [Methylobacter sp.]MDP3053829.1 thioredoxin family protein [Methylobacter sp.]MDP3363533.1 thioredoxin family protein [Methylobacter sp.]